MARCALCGRISRLVSETLGVCVDCIRNRREASRFVDEAHARSRALFPLPHRVVGDSVCGLCGRMCGLREGSTGYCGFIARRDGRNAPRTGSYQVVPGTYYYDPHPTNCVADPVCPAIHGLGYPDYCLLPSGEHGYYNIAVFYGLCNMDCLYCQNWEYRRMTRDLQPLITIDDLVGAVNHRTTCVCFFGGDPGPAAPHALLAARRMKTRAGEIGLRVFRICWETNGLWNKHLFREAVELSLETGGIVKIDFKAWTPQVYHALTGIEPGHVEKIKENIAYAAERTGERREPPLLVVSTLLVPGYVDEYEIDMMTRYVAELYRNTPYVFLGFHPDYMLGDLPRTSRRHAMRAVEIARKNGLRRVYVENTWLLGDEY